MTALERELAEALRWAMRWCDDPDAYNNARAVLARYDAAKQAEQEGDDDDDCCTC